MESIPPSSFSDNANSSKYNLFLLIWVVFLLALLSAGSYGIYQLIQKNKLQSILFQDTSEQKNEIPEEVPELTFVTEVPNSESIKILTQTGLSPTVYISSIQILTYQNETIYKNNTKHFSFKFPNSLILDTGSTENSIRILQKQDDLIAQRLLIEVENYDGSLEDYAGMKGYFSYGEKGDTTLDGHQTILFTKAQSQKDLCNEADEAKIRRIKLVLIKGDGYVLTFIPNDSCETYKTSWLMGILQTVDFTSVTFQ